jgi:site-specific DNA recombinase
MTMTGPSATRRVATYERVSSEDQRERETIRTQTDELARRLEREPHVTLVERYVDDGVSGTIPLGERPAGQRLLRDATAGRFEELWVYKVDRLGRDAVDLLVVRRRLDGLGVKLVSVIEGEPDLLGYDVQAVVADHYRREFLRRSADGINRAAREGRYCGGIVPLGYRVEGRASEARLVPDETPMWSDLSAADVVRWIYRLIGLEGRSCRSVAMELTALGVPTHYRRDGRGVRGRQTQPRWRAGHIRNMVTNSIYRGELRYGRRTEKTEREVISAPIAGLVSPDLWHAAQEALGRNRLIPKNTRRTYLLRGAIRCGVCGLTYVGSQGRPGVGWYRCNGYLAERGPLPGRCWGLGIRTDAIELVIWADIERFLRDPGDILASLDAKADAEAQAAVVAAESVTLARRLETLEEERQRAIGLVVRGVLDEKSLDPELDRIAAERAEIERRLTGVAQSEPDLPPEETLDLLAEVRRRLDEGLSIEQRQKIVRLLASIVVQTETHADGRKSAKALVTYRFPGVVKTGTGSGSWRPPAECGLDSARGHGRAR